MADDIKLRIEAVDNASKVFKKVNDNLKKEIAVMKGSGIGQIGGVFKGALAGGVIALISAGLSTLTAKAEELSTALHKGEISAGEMTNEFAKSIPLLGGFVGIGNNIRESLLHEKADWKIALELSQKISDSMAKTLSISNANLAARKELVGIERRIATEMARQMDQNASIGMKGIAATKKAEENASAAKIASLKEEADTAVQTANAKNKKAYDDLKAQARAEREAINNSTNTQERKQELIYQANERVNMQARALQETYKANNAVAETAAKRAADLEVMEKDRSSKAMALIDAEYQLDKTRVQRETMNQMARDSATAAENELRIQGKAYEADLAALKSSLTAKEQAIDEQVKAAVYENPDMKAEIETKAAAEKLVAQKDAQYQERALKKAHMIEVAQMTFEAVARNKQTAAIADEWELRRQGKSGTAARAEINRQGAEKIAAVQQETKIKIQQDATNKALYEKQAASRIAGIQQETNVGLYELEARQRREAMVLRLAQGGITGRLTGTAIASQEKNLPTHWMDQNRKATSAAPTTPSQGPAFQQREKTNTLLEKMNKFFEKNPVIASMLGQSAGNYGTTGA